VQRLMDAFNHSIRLGVSSRDQLCSLNAIIVLECSFDFGHETRGRDPLTLKWVSDTCLATSVQEHR
jgi:hypothetical protein